MNNIPDKKIPFISKWSEARDYLENLIDTINADIYPLLNTSGAAPFAICREIFSYIDHVGYLYSGKSVVNERSKSFMEQIMSTVDLLYKERALELYQMYRCGSVHEFQPKILENKKGMLLHWLCYAGSRKDKLLIYDKHYSVQHLLLFSPKDDNNYFLPVSTKCLIDDMIQAIKQFIQSEPEDERITAWNRAGRDLNTPYPLEFKI